MPAYSYKKQFCPFVKDGTKSHTIRSYRKYPVKAGDRVVNYYGMRSTHCTKLGEETCSEVKTIAITSKGTVVLVDNPRLPPIEVVGFKVALIAMDTLAELKAFNPYDQNAFAGKPCIVLMDEDKERLAWKDGFRPAGSTLDNPAGAFTLMMDFWRESHEFPFVGNIIYWNPQNLK